MRFCLLRTMETSKKPIEGMSALNGKPAIIAVIVIVLALGAVAIRWGLVDCVANAAYHMHVDNSEANERPMQRVGS